MGLSIQATIKGEVLQSRAVKGKDGKQEKHYHRLLVLDGFGIKETVDVGSNKGLRKPGLQEIQVAISLDRVQGIITGLRLWEV